MHELQEELARLMGFLRVQALTSRDSASDEALGKYKAYMHSASELQEVFNRSFHTGDDEDE